MVFSWFCSQLFIIVDEAGWMKTSGFIQAYFCMVNEHKILWFRSQKYRFLMWFVVKTIYLLEITTIMSRAKLCCYYIYIYMHACAHMCYRHLQLFACNHNHYVWTRLCCWVYICVCVCVCVCVCNMYKYVIFEESHFDLIFFQWKSNLVIEKVLWCRQILDIKSPFFGLVKLQIQPWTTPTEFHMSSV
jgi:hypothetical protein